MYVCITGKLRKLHVTLPVNMAPFSKEDKILIKSLYECKGYNTRQFLIEFPDKGWMKSSIDRLLVSVSEQFLHGTSAQYRLCSAILLKLYKS